jgi:hypothetical protein
VVLFSVGSAENADDVDEEYKLSNKEEKDIFRV